MAFILYHEVAQSSMEVSIWGCLLQELLKMLWLQC